MKLRACSGLEETVLLIVLEVYIDGELLCRGPIMMTVIQMTLIFSKYYNYGATIVLCLFLFIFQCLKSTIGQVKEFWKN